MGNIHNHDELIFIDLNVIIPTIVADTRSLYLTLNDYSEHQRENWTHSKRIIVYKSESQLREFIKLAKEGKNLNNKMYFGRIPIDLAKRIKKETGADINVEGYNLSISAYEIRKIFKDHGNEETELLRGQRAIMEDDIVNIPQIIQNPDKIMLADTLYRGQNLVIKFIKTINGRTTVVSYISKKSYDLAVQTMYSGKKSGPLATGIAERATINTPKAINGTGSATSNIEN
jgi:hypothetical protein